LWLRASALEQANSSSGSTGAAYEKAGARLSYFDTRPAKLCSTTRQLFYGRTAQAAAVSVALKQLAREKMTRLRYC